MAIDRTDQPDHTDHSVAADYDPWGPAFVARIANEGAEVDRELFSIEEGIRRLTSDPAQFLGIEGRGVLAPGAYADINVIDLEGMSLDMPRTVNDFPGGAARLIQTTSGYDYTIVNGEVFMESGQHTGALAGALLRSGPDER